MARGPVSIQAYCNNCGKLQACKHIGYPPETRIRKYEEINVVAYMRERQCLECGFKFETAELAEGMIGALDGSFWHTREEYLKEARKHFMSKSADAVILGWKQEILFEIEGLNRCKERFLEIAEKIESLALRGELYIEIDRLDSRIKKFEELKKRIETALRNATFFKGWN